MSLTANVIDIKIAFSCSVLEYSHSSEDVLTLYLVCMVTMDQPLVTRYLKCTLLTLNARYTHNIAS